MLNIKRQESSIHFANSPKQSIYAFPNTVHTEITKATATAAETSSTLDQNVAVSSTINSVLLSSLTSSSLSSLSSSSSSSSSLSLLSLSSSSLSSSSTSMTTISPTGEATGKSGTKLSTGAIAGIIVGGACFLIGILLVAFLLIIRRRNAKKNRLSLIEKTAENKHFSQVYYPNQKTTTEKIYETNSSSPTPLVNHNNIININPDNSNGLRSEHEDELMDDEMFWNLPPIGTFRVVSTYTQTLDDELYIQPGDKVQIYMEYDDGWCLGINLTRGGSRGVFPQHCINMERPL